MRTKKSVSGCALMLGGSAVSTYCKGQAVVVSWVGECYIANAWPAEYFPGLGIEVFCTCVDGRHSRNCDRESARARTSETHRHSVPLGASDGDLRQDLTRREAYPVEDASSTSSDVRIKSKTRMRRQRRAQKYTTTTHREVTLSTVITWFFRFRLSLSRCTHMTPSPKIIG